MRDRSVSVVIPTYNAAAFLARALASVLAQTRPPREVVVVDDCSTDDTVAVAERLAVVSAVPVRVLRLPRNSGGPGRPLNVGIDAAEGALIATLDQDDEFPPDKLALTLDAFDRHPDFGLVFGRTEAVGAAAHFRDWHDRLEATVRALPHAALGPGLRRLDRGAAYSALVGDRCLAKTCSNLVFPKAVWRAVGGFDERLRAVCDYRFLQQVAARHDLGFVDAALARWHVHAESLTVTAGSRRVSGELFEVQARFEQPRLGRGARAELRAALRAAGGELAYHARQSGGHRLAAAYLLRSLRRGGFDRAAVAALLKLLPHWAATRLRRGGAR